MALPYETDSVSDEVKAFYKEVDGKYVLDVEGVVPVTQFQSVQSKASELEGKISEFRANNIALKQQLEQIGGKTVDIEALLEPRIVEMKTNYTSQIEQLNSSKAQLEQHLERVVLSESVAAAAVKYGVLDTALPDVISRARETFTVKDGVAVSKAKVKDKDGNALTIQSWITGLSETASHLFAPSRGTGAQRPVSGVSQKPTLSAVDKIASGLAKR